MKWFDIIQDSEGNLETKGSLFETVLYMLVYNAKAFLYSGKMSAVTIWFLFALFLLSYYAYHKNNNRREAICLHQFLQ